MLLHSISNFIILDNYEKLKTCGAYCGAWKILARIIF